MKIISKITFLSLIVLIAPMITLASSGDEVDLNATTIFASKETVNADGIDQSEITVRTRTMNYLSASGATVELVSSRGSRDEIKPSQTTSDLFGKAKFSIRSLKNGDSVISVKVNGQTIQNTKTIHFSNGLDIDLKPGALIKIPSDSDPNTYSDTAVYYFASDGRRYVFPNEKVYFTWYPSFSAVRTISIVDMTKVPIGGNVTYRPGSRPVKFQTDNKVYAVDHNGLLRWIKTAKVAKDIYGEDWASKVDDINESFYVNYKFGDPITNWVDFMKDTIYNRYYTIEIDRNIK